MMTLVTGGSGSGKSEYAEMLAMEGGFPRIYIATMIPWDEEGRTRIARHRAMRKGKGFETVECYAGLSDAARMLLERGGAESILLECVSNLTANEFYRPENAGRTKELADAVAGEVLALRSACRHLVAVTNNVFDDGEKYGEETERYLEILAQVNRRLAASADAVTEVVFGIPVKIK